MLKIAIGAVAVVVAAAGGGAAALLLSPGDHADEVAAEALEEPQILSFQDEFIVPLVNRGRVTGHVVVALGLESRTLAIDELVAREPLYRDRTLEALLRHAALGAFDDGFVEPLEMNRLRLSLNEAILPVLPDGKQATVLITGIDRRDR